MSDHKRFDIRQQLPKESLLVYLRHTEHMIDIRNGRVCLFTFIKVTISTGPSGQQNRQQRCVLIEILTIITLGLLAKPREESFTVENKTGKWASSAFMSKKQHHDNDNG